MHLRYELYAEFVGEQSHIEGILRIPDLFAEVSHAERGDTMMTHPAQPRCSSNSCPSLFVSYDVPTINEPHSFPETAANRQLARHLKEILDMFNRCYSEECCMSSAAFSTPMSNPSNKISARIAACKILRHYVKEEPNEYWECVESMEEKLVPNIVGWLTSHRDVGVIYRVLKDMPWLLEKKADRMHVEVLDVHEVG